MRLFVAVNPPARLRQDLDTRLDTIRRRVRIAWTHPEAWHLTLAFLGEWPESRLPALGAALRTAVAAHRSFVVEPGRVGAFPGLQRPRVLFLHLDGGDPLRDLARDVAAAVDAAWPDGPQDRKPFRPHLTLARIKRPLAGAEATLLRALDLGSWDSFAVDTVHLVASELRPQGARYTVLETLDLAP
jgi:2'-5' RNA ligase